MGFATPCSQARAVRTCPAISHHILLPATPQKDPLNHKSGATTGKLPKLSKLGQTFGPFGNVGGVMPLSASAASKRNPMFFNTTPHLSRKVSHTPHDIEEAVRWDTNLTYLIELITATLAFTTSWFPILFAIAVRAVTTVGKFCIRNCTLRRPLASAGFRLAWRTASWLGSSWAKGRMFRAS